MDIYGDHALCCKRTGDIIARHNRVRKLGVQTGRALLNPEMENAALVGILQRSCIDADVQKHLSYDAGFRHSRYNFAAKREKCSEANYSLCKQTRVLGTRFTLVVRSLEFSRS